MYLHLSVKSGKPINRCGAAELTLPRWVVRHVPSICLVYWSNADYMNINEHGNAFSQSTLESVHSGVPAMQMLFDK